VKRVTGIGGIFFKAENPENLRNWYQKHLGIDIQEWGGAVFSWAPDSDKPCTGMTVWCVNKGENFSPSRSPFMVNYRVDNLDNLLQLLREEGCQVLEKTEKSDFGSFGWVIDPEGNKVELWQPPSGM